MSRLSVKRERVCELDAAGRNVACFCEKSLLWLSVITVCALVFVVFVVNIKF